MTDYVPTGNTYPELLRNLIALGVNVRGGNVMGEIHAHDDGTFTVWCVRIENGETVYLGYVQKEFATQQEAAAQIRKLPDDLADAVIPDSTSH